MDIQTRKINFVQEFLRLRNIKLIEKLEKILLEEKAKKGSFGRPQSRISIFNNEEL